MVPRGLIGKLLVGGVVGATVLSAAMADPYPPYWDSGSGSAIHWDPQPWPNDAQWNPLTLAGWDVNDLRVSDPSNGGTSPQNYVNVSSGCTDGSEPSVYWYYSNGTLFYRWRVEQIGNTYHTSGNNPSNYSSGDPWNSALWTVFFDVDGDGFREYAMHLDGSSGGKTISGLGSVEVDVLAGIYGTNQTQSLDYENDINISRTGHNPTGFVASSADKKILSFDAASLNTGSTPPSTDWIKGGDVTIWDYGTTRSIVRADCGSWSEYYIDYQIPFAMLTAGAPPGAYPIDADTPVSLFFATANSLNDPMQKDAVASAACTFNSSDAAVAAPYSDTIIFSENRTLEESVISDLSAGSCTSSTTISVKAMEALNCCGTACETTALTVDIYAYYDANKDWEPNDSGEVWNYIGTATNSSGSADWSYTWDATQWKKGNYLVGVRVSDKSSSQDASFNISFGTTDDHVTWSFLSAAQVSAGDYAKSSVIDKPYTVDYGPAPTGDGTYDGYSASATHFANFTASSDGLPGLSVGRLEFINDCGVDFQWRPNHELTVTPLTQVTYSHTLDISPGSGSGSLVFSHSSSEIWAWKLYEDSNDNGVYDSGTDTQRAWDTAFTPGFASRKFFATYLVPDNILDGKTPPVIDTMNITATYTVSGNDYSGTVTDVTTVVPSDYGYLTGSKSAAIDTDCDGELSDETASDQTFEDRKDVYPGQCAVFRVGFDHPGSTGTVTGVTVKDVIPTNSTFWDPGSCTGSYCGAQYETTPATLTNGTISKPAHGASGTIQWPYTDNPGMEPGQSGTVLFEVKIDE